MGIKYLAVVILFMSGTAFAAEQNPLSDLAASTGTDPGALLLLGDLYLEAGRLSDAKRTFKRAKMRAPEMARLGAAKIHMSEHSFGNAKSGCRKLARDFLKAPIGEMCSGWFWLSNGRMSRAIEEFELAVKKGDVAGGKLGIAEAMRMNREWSDAITAYEEAIKAFEKIEEENSKMTPKGYVYLAHLGKGLALEQQGETSMAVLSLKTAAQTQPASCLARYHYGRLNGNGNEAIQELEAAISMRPDWLEARVALGKAYDDDGNYKAAADAYRAAIAANKQLGEPYYGLAKALAKLGQDKEALDALDTLIGFIPNHADAYLLMAEIYAKKKDADSAIEALDRARDVATGDVEVFIRSAQIYMSVGRYTNARAYLNQAIRMKPKMSRAHVMLGRIACERRRFDEGRKHYDKALKGDLQGVTKEDIQTQIAQCRK